MRPEEPVEDGSHRRRRTPDAAGVAFVAGEAVSVGGGNCGERGARGGHLSTGAFLWSWNAAWRRKAWLSARM